MLRGKIIVLAALLVLFFGPVTAAENPTESQSDGCVAIDYLERLYGVGALVVAMVLTGFAFFGIKNINDFKATIQDRVTSNLGQVDEKVKTIDALVGRTETAVNTWHDDFSKLTKDFLDQKERAEREFRLRALHADCDLKILLYDLYTSLRGTPSDLGESQRLSDIRLTNLLKTVEDNADQAKNLSSDDNNIYVRFVIFKGQALNRRGHTAIALEELRENALPRINTLKKHLQATIHYNLSCYACLESNIEDSLKHLDRAIHLLDDVKAHAKSDPHFATLWADVRFQKLTK